MRGYSYKKSQRFGPHFDSDARIMGDEQFYPWVIPEETEELLRLLGACPRVDKIEEKDKGIRVTVKDPERLEADTERYPEMKHSEQCFFLFRGRWEAAELLKICRIHYKIKHRGKVKRAKIERLTWEDKS